MSQQRSISRKAYAYDHVVVEQERWEWTRHVATALDGHLKRKAVKLRHKAVKLGAEYQAEVDALVQMLAATEEGSDAHLDALADLQEAERVQRAKMKRVEYGKGTVWVSSWHWTRAEGSEAHFERMDRCADSQQYLERKCSPGCSGNGEVHVGCNKRDCPTCRPKIARKLRHGYENGMNALQAEAKKLRLNRTFKLKFLTLTVPHCGAGEVDGEWFDSPTVRRIHAARAAWRVFAGWLREEMVERSKGHPELSHYIRAMEWTEGDDGLGHPHFHLLLHSPFLPVDDIRDQWCKAWNAVTHEKRERLIVRVEAVTPGVYQELVKYLVKDLSEGRDNTFVDPQIMAEALAEFDGARLRQTSAGFSEWALKSLPAVLCDCCRHAFRHELARPKLGAVPKPKPAEMPEPMQPTQRAGPDFDRAPLVQKSFRF